DPAVRRACDRAIRLLRELGAAVREVSLPHTVYAVATYYIIAPGWTTPRPALRRIGRRARAVPDHARRRVRSRGAAPRAGRHVRAVVGLLRRLLPEGAADARADRSGLPQRLRSRRGSAVH